MTDTDIGNVPGMPEYVTIAEAVPLANRTGRTLRYLAARGRIPGARRTCSGVWLLPRAAVLALPDPRPSTNPRKG